jgi:pyruvate dehydrogenase E2 component (dihydrolipoamide acetyltransferase)
MKKGKQNMICKKGRESLCQISNSKYQKIPLVGIRKVIADKLTESYQQKLHINIVMQIDMEPAINLRKKLLLEGAKSERGRVSFNDIIIKAVASSLEEFPLLNSLLVDGNIVISKDINIGIAVAIEKGLIVPVIKQANKKKLIEISKTSLTLIEKAKKGTLSINDVSDGTFTITNLGMYDVDFFTPIINSPQNAILAVGKIEKKPIVLGENVVIKPLATFCLSVDHRAIDGALAAKFLQNLKNKIAKEGDFLICMDTMV